MDLNGDGHLDILSGSYSRMESPMAGLFQVLWGQSDATFQSAEVLNGADGEPLIIPLGEDAKQYSGTSLENICTRPTAIDWDADGDLDLVVGNFGGSFYVFHGESEGQFQAVPQPILAGGGMLRIKGQHSDPFVIDWDRDGDLDLLSGSSNGGVQWAQNIAPAGEPPELVAFLSLIPAPSRSAYGQLLTEDDIEGPTTSTRIWVDDVNADGKLDLLVGDSVTLTSPAEGISEAEFHKKHAEWNTKLQEASTRMAELMQAAQDKQKLATQEEAEPKQKTTEETTEEKTGAESSGVGDWFRSLLGLEEATEEQKPLEVSELEEAQQQMSTLYGQRAEFMNSERTGYVWLYLQK